MQSLSANRACLRMSPRPARMRGRAFASPTARFGALATNGGNEETLQFSTATLLENKGASANGELRLLTFSVSDQWKELDLRAGGRPGRESPRWLDLFTQPGQSVALRTGCARDPPPPPPCRQKCAAAPVYTFKGSLRERCALCRGGGSGDHEEAPRKQALKSSLLVPVASNPYQTHKQSSMLDSSIVELLVDRSLSLPSAAGGDNSAGVILADLAPGTELQVSEPVGRGFSSLFNSSVDLMSALADERNMVLIGSGARGIAALRSLAEWQPVSAHAGAAGARVSLFLEAPSAAAAAFVADWDRWREAGFVVQPCYGASEAARADCLEAALFRSGRSMAELCGGDPKEAAVVIAGISGEARGRLTKELVASGFSAELILFAEFV